MIVLASGSPRRREILQTLGVPFEVLVSDVPETLLPDEKPFAYSARIALAKGKAVRSKRRDAFIVAADTIVVVDGRVFGKPNDDADACAMLSALSGRAHQVATAVALFTPTGAVHERLVMTDLVSRPINTDAIARYVACGEGRDKAGAYAVQGRGAGFVRELRGSYTNVVGLPAAETIEMLLEAGAIDEWPLLPSPSNEEH